VSDSFRPVARLGAFSRQIAAAGHVLADEYIDDGYTATLLDRPALNRMRTDLKTDPFDRIILSCTLI
jgi:hypothetical protein